jgi:hypothetical protein
MNQLVQPHTQQARLVNELIQQKGLALGDYALFFVSGEGTYLRDGSLVEQIEEASGFVIDRHGRVFSFWLGEDQQAGRPALTQWEEVTPESFWDEVPEYQEARASLGLARHT